MLRRLFSRGDKSGHQHEASACEETLDERIANNPLHYAAFTSDIERLRHEIAEIRKNFPEHVGGLTDDGAGEEDENGNNVLGRDEEMVSSDPINAFDMRGNTALHIAVWMNSVCNPMREYVCGYIH